MLHPGSYVLAAVGLCGGPVWFFHGFQSFRRKRLIENTPTARIRSMAMGLVEVNGLVTARSVMLAPFSGRACAYWQVDIATQAGENRWHIVHHNQSGQPFFLKDDTGAAMVFPQGADCRVSFQVEEVCMGASLPDFYSKYMNEHCGMQSGLWRFGQLRFRERVLEDGQHAFVLGTAMPRSHAVTLSDEDTALATGTDGTLWTVQQQMLDHEATATIRKGTNESTFIISQSSERELTFMLALKAFGGMVGGPIAAVLSLGFWLSVLASFRH